MLEYPSDDGSTPVCAFPRSRRKDRIIPHACGPGTDCLVSICVFVLLPTHCTNYRYRARNKPLMRALSAILTLILHPVYVPVYHTSARCRLKVRTSCNTVIGGPAHDVSSVSILNCGTVLLLYRSRIIRQPQLTATATIIIARSVYPATL